MRLIALMGKAGSGKDTILHKLMESYPDRFHEIISCTTRSPREGEVDGVNYHFLEVPLFKKKVANGDMLEYTEFNGWYYGTAKSALSNDKINLGVFNPQGVHSIMKHSDIDLTTIHVIASDKVRLMRQLMREENPNVKEIVRRFGTDEADFSDVNDISSFYMRNETLQDLDEIVSTLGRFS